MEITTIGYILSFFIIIICIKIYFGSDMSHLKCITSNVDGLDFNHEGFAIQKNGRVYLLHASYEQKKVIISTELLVDYLNRINKHSGISVLRLL
jgi:hypothetical protein